jgi:hypothetical protein
MMREEVSVGVAMKEQAPLNGQNAKIEKEMKNFSPHRWNHNQVQVELPQIKTRAEMNE